MKNDQGLTLLENEDFLFEKSVTFSHFMEKQKHTGCVHRGNKLQTEAGSGALLLSSEVNRCARHGHATCNAALDNGQLFPLISLMTKIRTIMTFGQFVKQFIDRRRCQF